MTFHFKITYLYNLKEYLSKEKRVWYKSTDLLNKFSREELNALFLAKKIEVRNGLNCKVIKLI